MAVIWILKGPIGVPALVATVIVEELAVVLFGLKVMLTPLGGVDALNVTGSVSPPERVSDTVKSNDPPGDTLAEVGLTAIDKSAPESRRIVAMLLLFPTPPQRVASVERPILVHPVGIGLLGKHT